eukprot:751634-Hanusia_phi.AAC.2
MAYTNTGITEEVAPESPSCHPAATLRGENEGQGPDRTARLAAWPPRDCGSVPPGNDKGLFYFRPRTVIYCVTSDRTVCLQTARRCRRCGDLRLPESDVQCHRACT